jgi:catechol 2,3-dioxygenase-like lactoylglutathione lyase family enzyme
MKKLITSMSLFLYPVVTSWGQVYPPNDAGVSMGHVQENVRDVEASKKFWIEMGATPTKLQETVFMKFPGVLILLKPVTPSGGSMGTVVDHIAFLVQDFDQMMSKWKPAGLRIEDEVRTPERKAAYVFSPNDLRIEIIEDKSITVPIESVHLHYFLPKSSWLEVQAWYGKMFGFVAGFGPAVRGVRNPDADIPGISIRFGDSPKMTSPTKGRALDHIGFEVKNLEAFCKKLEANGIKFDKPFGKSHDFATAELTDPWGVSIELTEGLNRL